MVTARYNTLQCVCFWVRSQVLILCLVEKNITHISNLQKKFFIAICSSCISTIACPHKLWIDNFRSFFLCKVKWNSSFTRPRRLCLWLPVTCSNFFFLFFFLTYVASTFKRHFGCRSVASGFLNSILSPGY